MNIVISQPMYFPWVGMLEQIKLSDIFVYYNDVQFSKGSFTNRVQIKTNNKRGFNWLSVPLKSLKLGTNINAVEVDYTINWQHQHLELLRQTYRKAPFFLEMIEIVESLFTRKYRTIDDLSRTSMQLLIDYFKLDNGKRIYISSNLAISGASSQRVCDIARHFGCTNYITGHGAQNYLDHKRFEESGINVFYMNYGLKQYPQLNGAFTPYVSALDLIANCGKEGYKYIGGSLVHWRNFIH